MVVVGELAVVMVGIGAPVGIFWIDQAPVPLTGVFAAIVTEMVAAFPQGVWLGPALAVVGNDETVITTSCSSPAHPFFHALTL